MELITQVRDGRGFPARNEDAARCDDELIFGRNEPALQDFHATLRTHLSNEEQDRS
jgi:hypothetical protein